MRKMPKKWSVAFLVISLIISVIVPANMVFAEHHYEPGLDDVYKKGDDLAFEWYFNDYGDGVEGDYYSYWNDVYYFDKNNNLVLANSVSDNFYATMTELGEDGAAYLPFGEDLASRADGYACSTGEGDLKCTINTYKAAGNLYEDIDEYYFIGAVDKCEYLNISGDAKTFCETHSDNKNIMAFVEKEDEALFISSKTPLTTGITTDVELRINTNREIEYVELYLDPNCVKVNSIAPYDGWEMDANESGDGRYYFRASAGKTGGTVAGFNITILSETPDEEKFNNATVMALGQTYAVKTSNGNKYYAFTPTEDGDYAFISSRSPEVDPYAYLYQKIADEYRVINIDDDSDEDRSDENGYNNFRLVHTLNAGTTYYLRATSYGGGDSIDYDVRVERVGNPSGIGASDDFEYSDERSTISKVSYVLKMDAYVQDYIEYGCGGEHHGNCGAPYSALSNYLDDSYGGRGAGGSYGTNYYYGFDTLLDKKSCSWSNVGEVQAKTPYRRPNDIPLIITAPEPGDPYVPENPIIPSDEPSKPNNPKTVDDTSSSAMILVASVSAVLAFCYASTKKNRA